MGSSLELVGWKCVGRRNVKNIFIYFLCVREGGRDSNKKRTTLGDKTKINRKKQ